MDTIPIHIIHHVWSTTYCQTVPFFPEECATWCNRCSCRYYAKAVAAVGSKRSVHRGFAGDLFETKWCCALAEDHCDSAGRLDAALVMFFSENTLLGDQSFRKNRSSWAFWPHYLQQKFGSYFLDFGLTSIRLARVEICCAQQNHQMQIICGLNHQILAIRINMYDHFYNNFYPFLTYSWRVWFDLCLLCGQWPQWGVRSQARYWTGQTTSLCSWEQPWQAAICGPFLLGISNGTDISMIAILYIYIRLQ